MALTAGSRYGGRLHGGERSSDLRFAPPEDDGLGMFYVYIMTNRDHGTLYVGITNDVARRAWEHREGVISGFTKKYGLKYLVHVELFETAIEAIHREKRLKHWNRAWKVALIEETNPNWEDLYPLLTQGL